jgi:hypothetical protein
VDCAFIQVDPLDSRGDKADAVDHFSNWTYDVGDVEITRRNLVQHRREEKEIIAADQGHLRLAATRYSLIQL